MAECVSVCVCSLLTDALFQMKCKNTSKSKCVKQANQCQAHPQHPLQQAAHQGMSQQPVSNASFYRTTSSITASLQQRPAAVPHVHSQRSRLQLQAAHTQQPSLDTQTAGLPKVHEGTLQALCMGALLAGLAASKAWSAADQEAYELCLHWSHQHVTAWMDRQDRAAPSQHALHNYPVLEPHAAICKYPSLCDCMSLVMHDIPCQQNRAV